MEQFIPVNIFQKKGTCEVLPFPRFDRNDNLCGRPIPKASFGEKPKILPVFCKCQDSISCLFSVRNKNTSAICEKIFTEISVKMVRAHEVVVLFSRNFQRDLSTIFHYYRNIVSSGLHDCVLKKDTLRSDDVIALKS